MTSATMKLDEMSVIQRSENVAVHHEKRVAEVSHEGDRPGGSKRRVFIRIRNLDSPLLAATKVGFQLIR
jgi:hypothetical protein